jgi:hypothetical protein
MTLMIKEEWTEDLSKDSSLLTNGRVPSGQLLQQELQ